MLRLMVFINIALSLSCKYDSTFPSLSKELFKIAGNVGVKSIDGLPNEEEYISARLMCGKVVKCRIYLGQTVVKNCN